MTTTDYSSSRRKSLWQTIFLRKGNSSERVSLFEQLCQHTKERLATDHVLGADEEFVLACVITPDMETVLTTDRILYKKPDETGSIDLSDIQEFRIDPRQMKFGGFSTNIAEIDLSAKGQRKIWFEAGAPCIGFVSILLNIVSRNKLARNHSKADGPPMRSS
jgi:hypothetical protein